jgi:hypothetical protein
MYHKPHDGFVSLGNDDLFSRKYVLNQSGQMGFGFVDIDLLHSKTLA